MASSTHTRTETYEERFERLLNEAVEAGRVVRDGLPSSGQIAVGKNSSRENSSAITRAEEALFWARADLRDKGMGGDGAIGKQPTG